MDKSILRRLETLESRPQSKIPVFHAELINGSTQTVYGYELLRLKDVHRVTYDGQHQPSVDAAALYRALCGDKVEVAVDVQH